MEILAGYFITLVVKKKEEGLPATQEPTK